MSGDATSRALIGALLQAAAPAPLVAPDAEAGIAQLRALSATPAPPAAWHEAVAEAVRDGIIRDPVRLPPGALQCHWCLELTTAGRARLVGEDARADGAG
ncbi:MAG: hypothetical protein JSR21_07565 [Proteobacteria bacterium]|nr:hypothetical protein [Pseudomonadota bacterium]